MNEMLGHNQPPSPIEILRDQLMEGSREFVKSKEFWLGKAEELPDDVEDHETAGNVTQFIRDVGRCIKDIDAAREKAKAPYLEGGRLVDGHYKAIKDPLIEVKCAAELRLTIFQRRVADEERKRREAEAEKARIAALEAEAEAMEAAREADGEVTDALDKLLQAQEMAVHKATEMEKAAEAKPAELSRTRSTLGATASLRTEWTHGEIDRTKLDLEALRPYLPMDGIEKAVRAFIKAGGRTLRGTTIEERAVTRVR